MFDYEEIFFHITSSTQITNVWDYDLHDYFILSKFWNKFAPPHLVASAFINKNENEETTTIKVKNNKNKNSAETMVASMDHMFYTTEKPDAKQQKRLDKTRDIMRQLKEGISFNEVKL